LTSDTTQDIIGIMKIGTGKRVILSMNHLWCVAPRDYGSACLFSVN